jgi:hypothetical protein
MAEIQLPATRTVILAQYFLKETTRAETRATRTKTAREIPKNARKPPPARDASCHSNA